MRKCILLLAFSFAVTAKPIIFSTPAHKEKRSIRDTTSVIHTVIGNNEKDADIAIIAGCWYNNGTL